MNSSLDPDILKQTLNIQLARLYTELENFRLEHELQGKLNYGVWGSQEATGWLYYFPHADPDEEAVGIDFQALPEGYWEKITFGPAENAGYEFRRRAEKASSPGSAIWINMDLCWTHGPVLKTYLPAQLYPCPNNRTFSKIIKNIYRQLSDKMIIDLQGEMLFERSPVYRPE